MPFIGVCFNFFTNVVFMWRHKQIRVSFQILSSNYTEIPVVREVYFARNLHETYHNRLITLKEGRDSRPKTTVSLAAHRSKYVE